MKISGIYKIQSAVKPERIYIGSAVNLTDTHKRAVSEGMKRVWKERRTA